MGKVEVAQQSKRFLIFGTAFLIAGCILIYGLICFIKVPLLNNPKKQSITLVYDIYK